MELSQFVQELCQQSGYDLQAARNDLEECVGDTIDARCCLEYELGYYAAISCVFDAMQD